MKNIYILLFLFCRLFCLGQSVNQPLDIYGINTLWQYVLVDHSEQDSTNVDYITGPVINTIKISNNNVYLPWLSIKRLDLGGFGGLIDNIDLTNGNLIWQNRYGSTPGSSQELIANIYENEDRSKIEILTYKDTNTNNKFLRFYQPNKYIFDKSSGKLIRQEFKDSKALKEEKEFFKNFGTESEKILKGSNNYYVIHYYRKRGDYSKYFIIVTLNSSFEYIKSDTISYHFNSPHNASFSSFLQKGYDTLFFGFHENKQVYNEPPTKERYDSFTYLLYRHNLKSHELFQQDVSASIPYNWYISLLKDENNNIIVYCRDSIFSDHTKNRPRIAYLIYDHQSFELIERIDLGRTKHTNIYCSSLPNESGALIVRNDNLLSLQQSKTKKIRIERTDGKGNITLLRHLEFEADRYFKLKGMQLTKNNLLLIEYSLFNIDRIDNHLYDIQHGIIAIDGTKELGLVNATEDIHPDVHFSMSVSPNPATDQIVIDFRNNVSGHLSLTDEKGQILMNKKLASETQVQIKTTDLSSGIYLLHFTTDKGHTTTQKLVIKR